MDNCVGLSHIESCKVIKHVERLERRFDAFVELRRIHSWVIVTR